MDSVEARKSGLNLPAGMLLRLETARGISNLSSCSSPSSSSKSSCSDRFIPCRSSSRLHTFGLIEKPSPVKQNNNDAYSRLLKSELFGSDFASSPSPAGQGQGSSSPTIMSPNSNMLRFKTQHTTPNSPFTPAQHNTLSSTPPKPPRKVPNTPHKATSLPFTSLPVKVCFFNSF